MIDVRFRATLRPYQEAGVRWLTGLAGNASDAGGGILADDMGLGKALATDALVMTPAGWRRIGSLSVGDLVIGSDGKPTNVIGVYPQGTKPMYRVTTDDGRVVRCCDEHLWFVQTARDRTDKRQRKGRVTSLHDLMARPLINNQGNHRFFLPMPEPVVRHPTELALHPYLMGALLANGCFGKTVTHTGCAEQRAAFVHLLPAGVVLRCTNEKEDFTYRLSTDRCGRANPVVRAIKGMGLYLNESHERFVPDVYMNGSVSQRLALLQGLVDNDGTVSEDGYCVEYNTTSPRLASQVVEIVRSLGGVALVSTRYPKFDHKGEKKVGRLDHRIRIKLPASFTPVTIPRKVGRFKVPTKYPPCVAMHSIEPDGESDCVCIAVDASDHLYLAQDYVLTHNTVQTLAALLAMRARAGRPLAALIVAPTSVAGNWVGEVAKHAPGLPVALWAGPDRHAPRNLRRVAAAELVVTSYDLLRRDLPLFQRLRLTHLILDEAQALKTPTSATHAAVRSLAAGYVLAVTGTPVENRLADLWSLLAIVAPGLLPERRLFTRRYATPIANGDLKARAELRALVAPRLLRRTKQEVASDLPPKTIIDRRVPLAGVALATYRRVAAEVRAAVRAAPDDHALILAGLTRLRLAATDPRLVAPGVGQDRDAPKLVALHAVLGATRANGARVLVFSAFARALDLVGRALSAWGVRFLRLDGSTPERERRALVTRFQQDPRLGAFLISLKAGGTGITLTGASVVVLYDPWWNPMAEAQAIDRTHRIGQAVPVTAYRLIAAGTVEDKVRRLQGQKRALVRAVLGGGAAGVSMRSRADAAQARAVLATLLAAAPDDA